MHRLHFTGIIGTMCPLVVITVLANVITSEAEAFGLSRKDSLSLGLEDAELEIGSVSEPAKRFGDSVLLAQLDHARKARSRRSITATPTVSKVTADNSEDKEETFNATSEERAQFMHEYAVNSTDLETDDDDDDDNNDDC